MTDATASIWKDHPVLMPPPPQVVEIKCILKIWNNHDTVTTRAHVPLADANGVTVTVTDPKTGHTDYFTTNTVGKITGNVTCTPNAYYKVTFYVAGMTFGNRSYAANIDMFMAAKMSAGKLVLLPAELIIPRYIYPHYSDTVPLQHPVSTIGYAINKKPKIKEFEESYSKDNFNILIEGDSWFDTFSSPLDVFGCLKKMLEAPSTKPKKPVRFLQLQNWGQTADSMLADVNKNSQVRYLQEYVSKYRFDLIVLSCGGNDFAVPFGDFLNSGINEQALMASVQVIKTNNSLAMDFTYAPTNLFGSVDRAAVSIYVKSIIGTAFDNINFPMSSGSSGYETIINLVYDMDEVLANFIHIELLLKGLVNDLFHMDLATPVLTHTYSYPSFLDTGVVPGSVWWGGDGPFIHPALEAAGVHNPVMQALCIKALIDAYKKHVLDSAVAGSGGWLHYADARKLVLSSDDWADEMHLTIAGSMKVAAALYQKIKQILPAMFTP